MGVVSVSLKETAVALNRLRLCPISLWSDLDRDAKFNAEVFEFLKTIRLQPKRTSVQAPWQNGIAERWVGSIRREFLDQVIPRNERHLRRLLRDYVSYHHEDRIHDALRKD